MEAVRNASPSPACDDARALASVALDGALDEVGRRFLRRHLTECADCAAFAADIGSLTALLRRAPLEPYRGTVSGDPFGSQHRAHRSQWLTMASAVAVVIVAVASLPHDTPPSQVGSRTASAPVKLPIGQRSAASDFAARPVNGDA